MKKVFLVFLVLMLFVMSGVGSIAAAAESEDIILNGGFEVLNENGIPKNWTFTLNGTSLGEGYSVVNNNKDGGFAIKLKSENSILFHQKILDIIPGENYEVSMSVNPIMGAGLAVKMEPYGKGNEALGGKEYADFKLKDGKGWQTVTFQYKAPADVANAFILIRLLSAGEVNVDNVKMMGKRKPPEQPCKVVETLQDTPNLVKNGGFDTISGNGAAEWTPHGNTWDGLVKISQVSDRGNVLQIKDDAGTSSPWGRQLISGLHQDAIYQMTAWINTGNSMTGTPKFKFEFYSEERVAGDCYVGDKTSNFVLTRGNWQQVAAQFRMPIGAKVAAVYCRFSGSGEMFYDDVEFKMVCESRRLRVGSDAFVYSDWDKSRAYAELNNEVFPIQSGDKIRFELLDDDKLLHSYEVPAEELVEYWFETALLAEKAKKYTVRIAYVDEAGNALDVQEEPVYRYDRPSLTNENGDFIGADGKPIIPYFGYHIKSTDFKKLKEIGVNVVQYGEGVNGPEFKEALDMAQENGLYLALNLYAGMKPAAHSSNIERTKKVINEVKDHPALFGYMVMDEPFMNNPEGYEELRASYKLFRDMDSKHPVIICECEEEWLYKVITVCDFMSIDPYPGKIADWNTHVSDFTRTAVKVNIHNKPMFNIIQGWKYQNYEPSANDFRHMSYQALFAGCRNLGVYPISDSESIIWNLPLYEGFKSMVGYEYPDAFKAFSAGEYPSFAELSSDRHDVWYKAFVKDKELYIIVLNRTKEEKMVSIPLVSGGIKIEGFKAVSDDTNKNSEINGNGSFEITLKPSEAVRYKIIPTVAVDFLKINENTFIDIESCDWAKKEINSLASLGIVNSYGNEYKPDAKITRADFAMFLVRTLGLTADTEDNFSDVDANAYYAKDIAIGKALGVLNGVGDNKYNPDSEISRQDLMTIIARGMKLIGTDESLEGFSDVSDIAGYALESVKAMVSSGLIKGNSDGTVNPTGNATRAEAAVIMYRILSGNM